MKTRETGLLLSAPMIKAYQEGRKSQTRRTHGLHVINQNPDEWQFYAHAENEWTFWNKKTGDWIRVKCPVGSIDDEIYWKETWGVDDLWDKKAPSEIYPGSAIWYAADGPKPKWVGRTRFSMFLPREFSRYRHIPLLDIRCQRVQTITEEDAKAEGIYYIKSNDFRASGWSWTNDDERFVDARYAYNWLWDTIHGDKYPVSVNPWIFAYTFPKYEVAK